MNYLQNNSGYISLIVCKYYCFIKNQYAKNAPFKVMARIFPNLNYGTTEDCLFIA